MSRNQSAALQAETAKRGRGSPRIHLIDVQRGDGSTYFWSSHEGKFLSRITGALQQYKPWLVKPPDIRMTRSLAADGGDFSIQNLSGNLIDREVAQLFVSGEFEGAYFVYRPWYPLVGEAQWEFHGFLTNQGPDTVQVTGRLNQLFQPNEQPAYELMQTRDCNFRFTSARCGYRRGQLFVPLTTATSFGASLIGASGLSMTASLFIGEVVMIIAGTGAGQERFILSNTATQMVPTVAFSPAPDATSKFLVTGPGTMKVALTTANIFSASTIGNSGLARTVNGDADGSVYIVAGTGAGQNRAIASNTATTFSVAPNWTVTPDGTSQFVVVYRSCPKDRPSCVTRGVTERFPGLIFIQPQITSVIGPGGVGTGGPPAGGGGGGGGGRGAPISRPAI